MVGATIQEVNAALGQKADVADLNGKADVTALDAEVAVRQAADDTLQSQIDNLDRNFTLDPDYFVRDASPNPPAREVIAHVHSSALPAGTTHLGMVISGVNAVARIEVINTGTYTFNFASASVGNVSRVPQSTAPVRITFYDALNGGSALGHIDDAVRLVSSPLVLNQDEVDARAALRYTDAEKAKVAAVTANPFITNIASYDAAQDRFEDATNAAVALPAGAIVLTTQAIYDAAVADSFAFPANVIFLASS